jgi:ATP-dependent Clp protease protease subunit
MSNQTELTDLLVYGVDFKNRRLYFGDLTADSESSTDFTVTSIEYMIRAMHKMATDAPNKPIEIHMHSYGGDAYPMLRLHDEILSCSAQIKFFGGGAIMSAATWIMAVCDERNLHVNTVVMLHDGSDYIDGNHTDVQIDAAHGKVLQERLEKILADNSYMPLEFWSDILQRDVYITADEAVSLGLADHIIQPKKRGNLRRSRIAKMSSNKNMGVIKNLVKDLYKRTNRKDVKKIDINQPVKELCDPKVIIDDSATIPVEQPKESLIVDIEKIDKKD